MKIIIMLHIIVHFYSAFGARRRDAGNVLNDPLLAIEEVIANIISVCVALLCGAIFHKDISFYLQDFLPTRQ